MESKGVSFEAALKDAQQRGLQRPNPISTLVAWTPRKSCHCWRHWPLVPNRMFANIVTGIEAITDQDISFADEFNSVIRLIAIAGETPDGLVQCVAPMLVGRGTLAQVKNELNAVALRQAPLGRLFLQGPGAGGGATASAVLSDIADLAQGFGRPIFGADALGMEVAKRPICRHRPGICVLRLPMSRAAWRPLRKFWLKAAFQLRKLCKDPAMLMTHIFL